MKPLTFQGVTQKQVDCLLSQLSQKGHVQKQGAVYMIDAHSINATATFTVSDDKETGELVVNVLHKPIWLPFDAIESGLSKALNVHDDCGE